MGQTRLKLTVTLYNVASLQWGSAFPRKQGLESLMILWAVSCAHLHCRSNELRSPHHGMHCIKVAVAPGRLHLLRQQLAPDLLPC